EVGGVEAAEPSVPEDIVGFRGEQIRARGQTGGLEAAVQIPEGLVQEVGFGVLGEEAAPGGAAGPLHHLRVGRGRHIAQAAGGVAVEMARQQDGLNFGGMELERIEELLQPATAVDMLE